MDYATVTAEFDQRGFEQVLTHLAQAIATPECKIANDFNVNTFAGDVLSPTNKYKDDPKYRGFYATAKFANRASLYGGQ